ncbi:MAG: GNAT family N-acetyltransferase [Acidobacteria bacterium]|nr:MAG: GNAT family N-acetyltransferase [Acidobacteriota bacterium]
METVKEKSKAETSQVLIRQMQEADLDIADRICRVAFGTFLGLANPETCFGDSDFIHTRWLASPKTALCAELNGNIVGSNIVTQWGSVGFFGPLSVHPSLWDCGIARKLLPPTMELFHEWQVTHAGLFTFAQSPKHAALYQKFDFWPRFLTMIMAKPIAGERKAMDALRFSALLPADKASILKECFKVTDSIYPGLDVEHEVRAVDDQQIGDTVLLMEGSQLAGFAICHCGPRSEGGTGVCYLKFAALKSSFADDKHFENLLRNCAELGATKGTSKLIAGVNISRIQAYRSMMAQGFRTELQGVALQRGNEIGYNREGVYLIDDWR